MKGSGPIKKALVGYSRCRHTRAALEAEGFSVTTCDLLPEDHERHYRGNVWDLLTDAWDLAVLHPMCTYLTVSAAWAYKDPDFQRYPGVGYHQRLKPETLTGQARRDAQAEAIENFRRLDALPYPTVIENPAPSFISRAHRPPDQIIQPHEFGDDASKSTGLWISNAPKLTPTERVRGRWVTHNGKPVERWSNQTDGGQNKLPPSDGRWLERSATYPGIAAAIGAQIGRHIFRHGPLLTQQANLFD